MLKYIGWYDCDYSLYKRCCLRFGFNNETSPWFIRFMMDHGAEFRFLSYSRKGEVSGAVCLDHGWLANDSKNPSRVGACLPVSACAIWPPFAAQIKCLAPFKAKCLHPHADNFINTSFSLFSKREVAFSKNMENGFSAKTRQTRKREIRRFVDQGGQFIDVSTFDGATLLDLYEPLFSLRWGIKAKISRLSKTFFTTFHDNFFGDILFLRDRPVGMQLLVRSVSNYGLFIDFINIGYDTRIKNHSVGTIMMWSNLEKASQQAKALGLPLFYSWGFMSGAYKARWCDPCALGRMLWL